MVGVTVASTRCQDFVCPLQRQVAMVSSLPSSPLDNDIVDSGTLRLVSFSLSLDQINLLVHLLESLVCDTCQPAKVHRLPFNISTHITSSPLELVNADVWGPACTS